MGKITKFQKKCLVCGNLFFTSPSRIKSGKGKYCSKKCYSMDKKNHWSGDKSPNWVERKKYNCLTCNKEFKRLVSAINSKTFCSKSCYWRWLSENVIPPSQKGKKPWNKNKPWFSRRGGNHHNWKGGISKINNNSRQLFMHTIEYKIWRRNIFERDDFTCQICGEKGGKLRANHIKRYVDYPNSRININNGITICEGCDLRWVLHREKDWESYFYFNLSIRKISHAWKN